MPCIKCNVNVKIPNDIKESIKTKLGKSIEIIPGKSENWLMLVFNDNSKMYFRGRDDVPMAFIDIKLLVRNDVSDAYPELISEITKIFSKELNIESTNIFIKVDETFCWGYDGKML